MKFIHASDIHLDSPLLGLTMYEGAPVEEVRRATRDALDNLVELAVAEKVAFVLIAGDLYDGDWKDYNTGLYLSKKMSELKAAGIRVFIIAGNHDAESKITRKLSLPDNVKTLDTKKPETVFLEDIDVAIHGQGYSKQAITDNLASGYPEASAGAFNIGLLHTAMTGREGHEPYAPCNVDDLKLRGYDYWALGHVHRFEIISKNPWVVCAGNTQGRSVRETGSKGCVLVTVENREVQSVERREMDVLRWTVIDADATGTTTCEDVVDCVGKAISKALLDEPALPLAMRIRVSGSCEVHRALTANKERWINEIRSKGIEIGGGRAWVEKVQFETENRESQEALIEAGGPLADLLKGIVELQANDELLKKIMGDFKELQEKIPAVLFEGNDAMELESLETYRSAADDSIQLIVDRILSGGASVEDSET